MIIMSPFEAVFGKPPPSLPSYLVDFSPVEAVDQCLKEREDVLKSLKLNLQSAQLKQISIAGMFTFRWVIGARFDYNLIDRFI